VRYPARVSDAIHAAALRHGVRPRDLSEAIARADLRLVAAAIGAEVADVERSVDALVRQGVSLERAAAVVALGA